MSTRVLEPVQDVFRAVATTVVPEAAALGAEEWGALERIVERALAGRPPELQKQLVKFLRVIELWPLARRASRFTKLAPRKRAAVLKGLQDSRFALIRRGFWGLRTLIYMGYYARPEAAAALGYRASAAGWSARRVPNATPSEAHAAVQPSGDAAKATGDNNLSGGSDLSGGNSPAGGRGESGGTPGNPTPPAGS